MIRCPGCHTRNRDDALLCTMCKRVLRRASDPVPPPDAAVASHHTIDLPGAKAPPREFELAERPRRPSSRPPPPIDSPGTNPTSARTISYRPPPPETVREATPLERTLDVLARPFDWLLFFSVRAPDATETHHVPWGPARQRFSFVARIGFLAHVWGAMLLAFPLLQPGRPVWQPLVALAAILAPAWGARWWVARSWEGGDDPNPIAMLGATILPYLGIAGVAVLTLASQVGGLVRPETPGTPSLVGPGRTIAAVAIALYVALLGLAIARDRVRSR